MEQVPALHHRAIRGRICGRGAGLRRFLCEMDSWPTPGLDHTTGIFCTFGAVPGFFPGFFDQVVGTALLLGMILAVGDKFNAPPGSNLAPIVVGLIVVAIGISFGGMYGYAINPARDLGPRLFAVVMGFKNNGLTSGDSWHGLSTPWPGCPRWSAPCSAACSGHWPTTF